MNNAQEIKRTLVELCEDFERMAGHVRRLVELVDLEPSRAAPDLPPRQSSPLDQVIWFNTSQVAERLGMHRATVEKALAAGELHGTQRVKGGRWRIHSDCLDAWGSGKRCAHQEPA